MYPSIQDVLSTIGNDTSHRADWTKIHFMEGAFESFEFVFIAHLMLLFLDIQMNYPSVCKEGSKIFLMQSLWLMWQRTECSNLKSNG
jgi:hypothetical protein